MKIIKINLGSGNVTPSTWINVDYALGAQLVKRIPFFYSINSKLKFFNLQWNKSVFIHDLSKKFPWKDNWADIIYSSHTLEHLNKDEGVHFLKECHRVLKKDGIIRIVVPDLKPIVFDYMKGDILADDFLNVLCVSYEESGDTFLKRKLAPFIRFPHKCMYDPESLVRKISISGFKAHVKSPFESDIPDISTIEIPERTENAVIVEGKKI